MIPRVLRAGLDTVEVSFRGVVSEAMTLSLDQARTLAQGTDSPVAVQVGYQELLMQPRAYGKWRWRLVTHEYSVVARPKADATGLAAQVRFSAFGLANRELLDLWVLVSHALQALGTFEELGVSRADVCADFQGWVPTPGEMASVVCPAQYRATHGTEKGVQTFVFGKRDLVRVYDKTAELLVSGKTWMRELWGYSPNYTEGEPVWRVEYQARREVLKELGIYTFADLVAKTSALLDRGMSWAQLRTPTADATKTRWAEDPRWTAIREAVFDGIPLSRRGRVSDLMSLERTISQHIGAAAAAGAYFETGDYLSALQQLSMAAEFHMKSEGIDFKAKVQERRRRILSGG